MVAVEDVVELVIISFREELDLAQRPAALQRWRSEQAVLLRRRPPGLVVREPELRQGVEGHGSEHAQQRPEQRPHVQGVAVQQVEQERPQGHFDAHHHRIAQRHADHLDRREEAHAAPAPAQAAKDAVERRAAVPADRSYLRRRRDGEHHSARADADAISFKE